MTPILFPYFGISSLVSVQIQSQDISCNFSICQTQIERERESSKPLASSGMGIPIGNLTSQLFANIYLNEFDQFVKHKLKVKYYLRYCDDFVVLSNDPPYLQRLIKKFALFLQSKLKLRLHENKVNIRKINQGIDFLGYVVLPHYKVLRTKTKKRMLKKINAKNAASYLGLLKHCNSYKLAGVINEKLGS